MDILTVMAKHFEDLWEEAEVLSTKLVVVNPKEQLHSEIDKLFSESSSIDDKGYSFGKILYILCSLSLKWNINTFAALLRETQDRKVESMDEPE